jgi:hypothetical protein
MKPIKLVFHVLLLAVTHTRAQAQDYRAEAFTAEAPEQIAQPIRAALSPHAIRVLVKDGPLVELWLRAPVPVRARPADALGVAYAQFTPGTLIGAVRVLSPVRDYRNRQIAPGVYTLRYALHPVDGNHMGVAPQRDFLLFVSPTDDSSLEPIPFNDLVALARKALGAMHPGVWSLPAPPDKVSLTRSLVHNEDEAQWLLSTSLTVRFDGGQSTQIPLTLVIAGHAPES